MAIGSGTAGFAQGLASGFQTGARYGIEAEDMRARRDMEGRRLKMAEDTAEINKRTGQLQNEALERSAAKQKAQDEAWTMALNELAGGQPIEGDDPSLPSEQRFGRALVGRKPNAAQWTKAANILAKAGLKEGIEYMNFAHGAMQEGAVDLLRAMSSGDLEGAKRAYNATGVNKLASIEPVQGADGKPSNRFVFKFEDGSPPETYDPRAAFEMLTSPAAYQRYVSEQQAAERKAEQERANIDRTNAAAFKDRTANDTRVDVAEIGAESREDVAAMRLGAGGGGGGRGGSRGRSGTGIGGSGSRGAGSEDLWKGAEQRQKVLKEVDEFVLQNFGQADAVGGKQRHTEDSRRVSSIATQIYGAAVEGGQPMSVADAARLATEGRAAVSVPRMVNGRLVAEQIWEVNGVKYPMGAAAKPVTQEQAREYLSTLREQLKGSQIKPEDLRSADDTEALARALGKPIDEVVRELLGAGAGKDTTPSFVRGKRRQKVREARSNAPGIAAEKGAAPPGRETPPGPANWSPRPPQMPRPAAAGRPGGILEIDSMMRR